MENELKKRKPNRLWQKSFHDHIIRNKHDYDEIVKYIHDNPSRLYYDELYEKE